MYLYFELVTAGSILTVGGDFSIRFCALIFQALPSVINLLRLPPNGKESRVLPAEVPSVVLNENDSPSDQDRTCNQALTVQRRNSAIDISPYSMLIRNFERLFYLSDVGCLIVKT